jgi:hypothetical protein
VIHGSEGSTQTPGPTNNLTNAHNRYTEATNAWASRTLVGSNRAACHGAHFNGFGYQTAGSTTASGIDSTTTTTHSEFNFGGNSWTGRAAVLSTTGRHLNASSNDQLRYYLMGGKITFTTGRNYWYYFTSGLSWTNITVGSFQGNYDGNGLTSLGDGSSNMWLIVGSIQSTGVTEQRRTFRHTGVGGWSEFAAAPLPNRRQAMCFVSQGCGVDITRANLIAGLSSGSEIADNDEYDSVGNSWTSRTSKTTTVRLGVGARANGDIYYIGGFKAAPVHSIGTNERWDPGTNAWATRTVMPVSSHFRARFAA